MEALITGLLPNEDYIVQVRSGSFWSTGLKFTTTFNRTPPSQPAAPTFFGNQQSIMVQHSLNKVNGTNLEQDVSVLEVYISSNNFSTQQKVGEIPVANPESDISAIGSFPFATADNITYRVRVVAVNSSGVSSEPSPASAASNVTLLEHVVAKTATIESLEANKITAGTGIINDISIRSRLTVAHGGDIRSSNYSFGSSGFNITSSSLEINTGIFRGSLSVGNVFSVSSSGYMVARNAYIEGEIQGSLITGGIFRTSTGGARVELNQAVRERIRFYNGLGQVAGAIGLGNTNAGNITITSDGAVQVRSDFFGGFQSISCSSIYLDGAERPLWSTASSYGDQYFFQASLPSGNKYLHAKFSDKAASTSNSYNHQYIYNSAVGIKFLNSSATLQIRNGDEDNDFGDLRVDTVMYNSLSLQSDPKGKENIQALEDDATAMVRNTPVYSFNYMGKSKQMIGWMANEAPPLAQQGFNQETINVSNMMGILWKAVQEIDQRLTQLEGA